MSVQSPERRFGRADLVAGVVVASVIGLTAWREAAGFTRYVLFFDDAWAALPAHESVSTALQMSVSTPGWTLLERWWILAGSFASSWAQLPAYLTALVMGFTLYGALRWMRLGRWPSVISTIFVVTNPTTLAYATRVKPYTLEMVLAIVLLVAAERARRRRSSADFVVLGVLTVVAFTLSFAVLAVVAGVWIAAGLWSWNEVAVRRRWLISASASAAASIAIGIPFFLNRPGSLGENWTKRGYMGAYDSLHDFLHNVEAMFAGFVHNMTGLPVSSHFPNVDLTVRDRVLAVAAVLSFAIVFWLVLRASTRQSRPELLAPTLALAAALALAFADVLPFGDGRTDEVLYPCVAVLIAAGLDWLWRASSKIRWMRVGTAVVAGTVLALALNTTVTKDARYPEAGISALIAKIRPYVKPGDVIVVPTYLSFSWAEAGLSPWRVDLNPVQGWPQGFRVASTTTSVILPVVWTGPDPQLRDLSDHYQRVWYIGYELAVWNPYAPTKKFPGTLPMYTYTRQQLKFRGWRVAWFPTRGYHCYAELMTHTAAATK